MAALVLVIGGAKLDAARPVVGRVLAVAIPVVPVLLGLKRVEGGNATLERWATAVGWTAILGAEACVAGAFFHQPLLTQALPLARFACAAAVVASLVANTVEARSHGKGRFAGYVGITAGYGVFISTHVGKDPFSSVFGAFFVGMFVGGAALLFGELLSRVLARR
jgi:hypothetical protein